MFVALAGCTALRSGDDIADTAAASDTSIGDIGVRDSNATDTADVLDSALDTSSFDSAVSDTGVSDSGGRVDAGSSCPPGTDIPVGRESHSQRLY